MTTVSEPTFVKAFLSLLEGKTQQIPSNYVSPEFIPNTVLAKMPNDKKRKQHVEPTSVKNCKVSFKSIKEPKFTLSQEFPSDTTILSLKQFLTEKSQPLAGYEAVNVKLLLKGRSFADSKQLDEIEAPELSFIVAANKPVQPVVTESDEITVDTITPEIWAQIKSLLSNELGSDKGPRAFEKLHSAWVKN